METAAENPSPSRIKLIVEVPYEELKPSLDTVYEEIGSQIQVPGFRRGHVPNRVVDQHVDRGVVIQEAINNKLSDFYRDTITEAEQVSMLQPEVDAVELPNATGENDGQSTFITEATVHPVTELPDLSRAKLTMDAVEVTDGDIDTELDNLRARLGSLKPVGRKAETGDLTTIDLRTIIDGEEVGSTSGVSYEISKDNIPKGLDIALRGLKTDESATFTTELADGEHAGEQVKATMTATVVKQRKPLKVDDEFVQLAPEFDTVGGLHENPVKQVTERKTGEQAVTTRDVLLEHLRNEVAFDVLEAVIEAEVVQHLRVEGKDDDEEHAKKICEDIVNGVRDQTILDVLAEDLRVDVAQGGLLESLFQIAQQYGIEPVQFPQGVQQAGWAPAFVSEVARNKLLAIALRQTAVADPKGEVVDLSVFIDSDGDDVVVAAQIVAAATEGEDAEWAYGIQGAYELRRIPRSRETPPKLNRRAHLLLEGGLAVVRGDVVRMISPTSIGTCPG